MNKKGQALVEFVIILPIFLMLLFIVIDFGKILFVRVELENLSNDVIRMYDDGKNFREIEEFLKQTEKTASLKVENENDESTNFYLTTEVTITTPGLNIVLDNPYIVEVKRVVYNGT